jgi:hypothetical protein
MGKFNLSEAAKAVILGEGSKETFDANIASKKGQRELTDPAKVGSSKLPTSAVAGQQDVGEIGQSPERSLTDELPDYTKGVPSATPPGATPPVGAQGDGVGAAVPANQPQSTMGRSDIATPVKTDATDYAAIRDRIAGKLAPQMMQATAGSVGVQSYAEDIDALMQGEELSEEFKVKATTIFEAAVLTRVDAIVEEVETQLMEQFEIALEEVKQDLASKVDDYLNYMVEEWMSENEIAVEKGVRAEIVEGFIEGLRDLFVEHYIDIPADKVDVVEELTTKVEDLESALNEQISKSVELSKELNEQKKIEAIYTACEGLSQTQVEKLKSLAENVEFTTEEEFASKLSTLKESYFKADVKMADNSALDDEVIIEEETKKTTFADPSMEVYAKTISQSLVK